MKDMYKALRALGFKRTYDGSFGGVPLVSYQKRVDDRRTVKVQLWGGDGPLRASSEFHGCSDTVPTEFTDIAGMHKAVEHESTRMDSKYAKPGSLPSERVRTHFDQR